MPMSESEKYQGNVLVCHSNDKFEHLPIKKRRFLFRSPSPPPQIPSPANEESSYFSKSQDDPIQPLVTCSVSCKSELGTLAVDKAAVQGNIKSVEDFSSISILAAAAACSSSLGREFGYAEDGSGVEEPSVNEGPVEFSTNSEAHSFSKGLVKEEYVNPPDISIGGALSCVTTTLAGELASISTDCTSLKVENLEKSIKDPFHEDSKPTVPSDVSSSMRDEDIVGSQKLQSRDDRLHWDLNVVMDAWEQPSDYQNSHISDCISQGSGIVVGCPANKNSAENHDLLNEPESSMCDDKKKLLHYEPSKSLDQISQGNTRNQAGDVNHKNQIVGMYNMSISSEYKSVPSSFGDGNSYAQPFVSKPFDDRRQSLKDDDNDSLYEDGELVLEEYDAVNEKTEHIDNVFDKSSYIVTATDHHYSESGQIRRIDHRNACNAGIISSAGEIANELCPESDGPITNAMAYGKDDNLLKLVHSRDEKMEGPASSEMFESNKLSVVRVRDGSDGKGRIYNLATKSPDSEGTDTRTGYRRGFLSQSNGPVGCDMYFREDQAGNRSKLGSSYMKYSERARCLRQSQPRVHKVNSWNGSSDAHRAFKHNYSPTCHTQVNPVDEDDMVGEKDRDGTLNTESYLSQSSTNDESIADVDMTGNFQPNRRRFLRYDRQTDHGSGRGRFHRRPLSQRDISFSPNERRGYQFVNQSHSRSPSRSRTRSPEPRAPRGSPYLRHTSRSPNFRAEPRMTRMRSPPHQPRFRPFQRDHGSPPPSRWIVNRKDELGHFNYKHKSPNTGRFSDSARNSKPDVHYRQYTGRFSEMEGNGRPHRLEENFENRRREFGIANRLCRDNDDGFVSRNRDLAEFHSRGNNRDIDNRNEEMPRRFKRDGNFMYDRDGKFSSNSKQFGFGRMDSISPGRYNEMNERIVYLPRRGDVDDNVPIPQSSCDDDASDSRVDDLPIIRREEQQFDSSEQEKKLGEASESIDVEVPAEK